jgi:anthranilate synthase component 1
MHITTQRDGDSRGHDRARSRCAFAAGGHGQRRAEIRAMQIIDELEPTAAAPTAARVGYLDFAGNMDTCIALRTIVWRNGDYDVQAGAASSPIPSVERYDETLNKAKAMLKRRDCGGGF